MKSNKILAVLASLLILMMCLSAVSAAASTGEHNTNVRIIDNSEHDININNAPANDNNNFNNTDGKLTTHISTDVNPFDSKVISSQLEDENNNSLAEKNIEIVLHNGTGAIIDMKNMTTDNHGLINYDISKLKPGQYQISICFTGDDKYESSGDTQDFTVEGGKSKIATHIYTDVDPFDSKVISSQLEDKNNTPLAGKNIEIVLHNGTGAIVDMKNMTTDNHGLINYDISKLKPGKYQISICFTGDDKYESSGDTQDFTVKGSKSKLATYFNTDVEPFGDKVVSTQLCDENNNPLVGKTIKFTLYDKNGVAIASESKTTNNDGCAEFDTSKLKNGTYKLSIIFEGDNQYNSCSDMVPLTIGDSKNPIDMQNTGVPLIIIACVALGLIGVGYKKYNK